MAPRASSPTPCEECRCSDRIEDELTAALVVAETGAKGSIPAYVRSGGSDRRSRFAREVALPLGIESGSLRMPAAERQRRPAAVDSAWANQTNRLTKARALS